MSLSIIVAMTPEGVIGKNNQLPWHLPEDLKRFKSLTMGHPIIMGRKTYESIGKALPGRKNIVVSHNTTLDNKDLSVVRSLDEAMKVVQDHDEAFVIGGASLFQWALPLANKIYLTLVHKNFSGDVFFPEFDLEAEYDVVDQTDHVGPAPESIPFSFISLEKKRVLINQ